MYYNSGTIGSPVWTEINRIQTLTHPSDEKNIVEVARFGQTYPRKLTGSASTGNCEMVVNFDGDDPTHTYLLDSYANSDKEQFRIVLLESCDDDTIGHYMQFDGQVASKSSTGDFDSIATISFSLSVDGALGAWTPLP